jgi:hypothetical protein
LRQTSHGMKSGVNVRVSGLAGAHTLRKASALTKLATVVLFFAGVSGRMTCAQMVSPSIDQTGEPFSYFSQPVDEIGVMNAPSATEITPEGYLYSGFGELMFLLGPEQTPLAARVRTLEDGALPIVSYQVEHLGVEYGFRVFAAAAGGQSGTGGTGGLGGAGGSSGTGPSMDAAMASPVAGPVVNFVRITLHNPGTMERAAFLTTAMRYQGEQTTAKPTGDNRFVRPAVPERVGAYAQSGEPFRNNWSYSLAAYGEGEGACLREGRALFLYPLQPAPVLSLTLHTQYNHVEPLAASELDLQPTTPVCRVSYTVPLQPGESRTIELRMPLIPAELHSEALQSIAALDEEKARRGVEAFWHGVFADGMRIELPEAKPVETFDASLMYDLLARNAVDGQFVQTVNQLQYHRFYLRDSADFVRMYDATGYSKIASEDVAFFGTRQLADGDFLSQPQQYDGWGEALWTFGEHYRRTHDLAFAQAIYPRVVRAVAWLQQARAADPLHLMPASDVKDNEYVAGHLSGYNFLALDGLGGAIELAEATGHAEDAARFQAERDAYRATFLKQLAKATEANHGVLPPALDIAADPHAWKGTDWGNLLAVTPEPVLDPMDPRVTATLKDTQARYREGIMTYAEPQDGVFLHHYLTIKNTLTELVRGEQEQPIRELYAVLLHTSATQAGFEYAIRPWGERNFEGNLSPHGWFAADYRNLLRNMMVREQGETLHLLSAVSPAWVVPRKAIRVVHAPSYFGSTDFTWMTTGEQSATLTVTDTWTQAPKALVVHVPWFLTGVQARADGQTVAVANGLLVLPVNTREVTLHWAARLPVEMSFARTVAGYEAEYRRRYALLLQTGSMAAGPQWQVPQ